MRHIYSRVHLSRSLTKRYNSIHIASRNAPTSSTRVLSPRTSRLLLDLIHSNNESSSIIKTLFVHIFVFYCLMPFAVDFYNHILYLILIPD